VVFQILQFPPPRKLTATEILLKVALSTINQTKHNHLFSSREIIYIAFFDIKLKLKNIGMILELVQGKGSDMIKIKYFVDVLSSG
jgi:hypothetical protein